MVNLSSWSLIKDQYLDSTLKEKTFDDVLNRVTNFLFDKSNLKQEDITNIKSHLFNKQISVNSPLLMNAGKSNVSSACFIIDVEDSVADIFSSLEEAALIQKHGAGVGLSLSKVRGKNEIINSTGGTSSGVIAWMKQFDTMIEGIKQGGKRRGALLISLPIDHPDIEDFIDSKTPSFFSANSGIDLTTVIDNWDQLKPFRNMNISVVITDKFMKALPNNENFALISPVSGKEIKTIKAKVLYNKLLNNAFYYGDPGILFGDTINNGNPLPSLGPIRSSNPCGEVLLPVTSNNYQACNLVALNLPAILDKVKSFNIPIDELKNKLYTYVRSAVLVANIVVERGNFILQKAKLSAKRYKPIGVGIMDLASVMIKDKIVYGDNSEAITYTENVFKAIRLCAIQSSIEAVSYFGKIQSNYINEKTIFQGFPEYKSLAIYEDYVKNGIANCALLSVAPTGATGLLMGAASGGIEPIFAFKYTRNVKGKDIEIVNSDWESALKKLSKDEKLPKEFITTKELSIEDHYAIQKSASKYVDLAISKTINLSKNETLEDIDNLIMKAWQEKIIKGLTIFNPNGNSSSILKRNVPSKKLATIERSSIVTGETRKIKYMDKHIYITINYSDNNKPIECFISSGDPGASELNSFLWSTGWFISNYFKYRLPLDKLFSKMLNLKSFERIVSNEKIYSGIIEMLFSEIYNSIYTRTQDKSLAQKCPACGKKSLISEGGCWKCLSCAWAKC